MKKDEEQLPIFEVRGCRCEGVLVKDGFVKGVNFRKIKTFLEQDGK